MESSARPEGREEGGEDIGERGGGEEREDLETTNPLHTFITRASDKEVIMRRGGWSCTLEIINSSREMVVQDLWGSELMELELVHGGEALIVKL
jgi:hypothetical protein